MAHQQETSLSQTLDDDPQSQQQNDPPTSTTSSSDPTTATSSLSRNLSSSRLNAKAPEFVPSSSSSSSRPLGRNHHPTPPQSSPTGGGGLVHVYPPPPNSPYHVPVPVPVPVPVNVQNHHIPYPHQHHHVPVIHFHQNQQHHHRRSQIYQQKQEVAVQPQQQQQAPPPVELDLPTAVRNGLTDESTQKIISQVEYYFSDVNLATTDHLMRFINKDPEGYVPISVVASFKKIKTLISSNSQLAAILRNSAKLVVSEDGKKVRRQLPLTESDMEELQSRIIVAENLPEDHCYQNLMKIFSSVGSVKTIRTCQPQASNGGASSASRTAKADGMLFSNKLHAFVEYESVDLAEKAIGELNEEGNWRNGLRVRLLLRRTTKAAQGRVKRAGHEGEAQRKEDDTCTSDHQQDENEKQHLEDPSHQPDVQSPHSNEPAGEEQANGKEGGGQKKGRNRGRGKGRGRQQYHHNHRGNHQVGTPPSNNTEQQQPATVGKQQPPGPRMPDGTRGFSLGRGKPIAVSIA
ncbi:hypothetical protein LguiA_002447 [Lonicera macranthoides]